MFLRNILSQFLIVKDNFASFKTTLSRYISMQTGHAYYCLSQFDVSLRGQHLGVLSRHVRVGWFQEFKFNQLIHSILINKSWIYLIVFGICRQIQFWKLRSVFSGCAGFQITTNQESRLSSMITTLLLPSEYYQDIIRLTLTRLVNRLPQSSSCRQKPPRKGEASIETDIWRRTCVSSRYCWMPEI